MRALIVLALAVSFSLAPAPAGEPARSAPPASAAAMPVTGREVPALKPFDDLMTSFLAEHGVPGAALAVARGSKLLYARGFGLADKKTRQPVEPESLFRIASISKPVTAIAVMQLVEHKKLKLSQPIFKLLGTKPYLAKGDQVDPRVDKITVDHLLHHTGGWDRGQSGDPMFMSDRIAAALGVARPAGPGAIIRYMMGRPLDFDPGERSAYSNFGYCLLGRAIEKVTGQTYQQYVRQHVLAPVGVKGMWLGKTLPAGRRRGEVRYYATPPRRQRSVFPGTANRVPSPYGAWCLEAMDAHGGWLASAPDLVKLAMALDDPAHCPILSAASIKALFARPAGLAGYDAKGKPKAAYYARGWLVRPVGTAGRANTWHAGGLPGTSTLLVRRHDGLDWAVLFNTNAGPDGKALAGLIDPLLHRAAAKVKSWPEE